MLERINKKIVDNILDRIIFESIGRITPMKALNKVYEDRKSNSVYFKGDLDIMHSDNRKFYFVNRVRCDTYQKKICKYIK